MNNVSDLPDHLRQAVRDALQPGEQIVWLGQPHPRLTFRLGMTVWWFFVPWLTFASFIVYFVIAPKVHAFSDLAQSSVLGPLILPLVGMAGMSIPFWVRRTYRNTVYVITGARALIVEGGSRIKIESFSPAELTTMDKQADDNDDGDLVFRVDRHKDSDGDEQIREVGFMMIEDATHVHHLLTRLASTRLPSATPARAW